MSVSHRLQLAVAGALAAWRLLGAFTWRDGLLPTAAVWIFWILAPRECRWRLPLLLALSTFLLGLYVHRQLPYTLETLGLYAGGPQR